MAQAKREWRKAEGYYQQALEVKIEFNDRYEQARIFGQLGLLKKEQEKFAEAQDYLLQALEIFRDFNDEHNLIFIFSHLRDLWRKSGNKDLTRKVGEILGMSEAKVWELFEQFPDESANEEGTIE